MSNLLVLWDEFLAEWPLERVKNMTLEEYVGFQDKNTFTYSVETKYKAMGSINGSPSYKFGIFKRNPIKEIKEKSGTAQGAEYSWQSRFGKTEQEAFIEVRNTILTVISAVQLGDMDALETISLANMFKWKIAFLYQRRDEPCVVNIFSNKMLAKLTGLEEQALFREYYSKLIGSYDKNEFNNIADYGQNCWEQLDNEEQNYDSVYWFLGASYGSTDDQTKRFLEEGVWQNGSDGKFQDKVKKIAVGDKIAIKSVYTQTHDLPFDNGGNMASVMDIKAIGIVTDNYGDGETLEVDWHTDFKKRTWYSFTYQPRLWQVYPTGWKRKALIDFAFNNAEQEYDKFINVEILGVEENDTGSTKAMLGSSTSLNTILYGPPGTGKTYHTIEAAVKTAEPNFKWETRSELKAEYERLVRDKRIRFVTFHQSYGYEEFVIGLTARTQGERLSYFEKDGIFKEICDEAKNYRETAITKSSNSFVTCWGAFVEHFNDAETGLEFKTVSGKSSITVYDIENDTIRFDKKVGKSVHSMNVKTLKAIFNNERKINGGLEPYYAAMVKYLKSLSSNISDTQIKRKNYVLVIDEINRGNISKIFGELITLIEPSKRLGNKEALEVILPNSGEPFSVPNNLYLIGTMNTADRSLAMMDTALRRRFDFQEMMPKPELFAGKSVNGIQLELLLATMNKRIEVLYDREHMLGHAFLMPVLEKLEDPDSSEAEAFVELQNTFKNKIIPLLEEYFYEDWNKIRLILGDNRKTLTQYIFVQENTVSYNDVFGQDHGLENYEDQKTTYQLSDFEGEDSVWLQPLAYQAIYDHLVLKTLEKQDETQASVGQ